MSQPRPRTSTSLPSWPPTCPKKRARLFPPTGGICRATTATSRLPPPELLQRLGLALAARLTPALGSRGRWLLPNGETRRVVAMSSRRLPPVPRRLLGLDPCPSLAPFTRPATSSRADLRRPLPPSPLLLAEAPTRPASCPTCRLVCTLDPALPTSGSLLGGTVILAAGMAAPAPSPTCASSRTASGSASRAESASLLGGRSACCGPSPLSDPRRRCRRAAGFGVRSRPPSHGGRLGLLRGVRAAPAVACTGTRCSRCPCRSRRAAASSVADHGHRVAAAAWASCSLPRRPLTAAASPDSDLRCARSSSPASCQACGTLTCGARGRLPSPRARPSEL